MISTFCRIFVDRMDITSNLVLITHFLIKLDHHQYQAWITKMEIDLGSAKRTTYDSWAVIYSNSIWILVYWYLIQYGVFSKVYLFSFTTFPNIISNLFLYTLKIHIPICFFWWWMTK